MKKQFLNFSFSQMSTLKYFIPLVVEGNKRGIQSKFFVKSCGKYNCVHRHNEKLTEIINQYDISIFPFEEITNHNTGPMFFLEDQCLYESANIDNKKYSITSMDDFQCFYNKPDDDSRPGFWINYCDHVIMPGEHFPKHYNTMSSKNLYFGSPKYDVQIDDEETYKKYNLNKDEKKALLIFPRRRDVYKIDLEKLYRIVRDMGYKIIVKTRGKDPAEDIFRGDYYFEDDSWYPHTTMELIKISDFIINFSSTTIKECVLLKKPLINFHIKPFDLSNAMGDLYTLDYCKNLDVRVNSEEIKDAVNYITSKDLTGAYKEAEEKFLFEPNDVSKKILDFVLA